MKVFSIIFENSKIDKKKGSDTEEAKVIEIN